MKQIHRRRWEIFIGVWLATAIWIVPAGPILGAQRKPNILLIVGDDMGYADIGVHGATDIRTPHLDALARHGVRFSSGYVTGPPHEALYWRFGPQMAIRMGDWKLVKALEARGTASGGFERRATHADLAGAQLFNLATDMGERVDLAGKEPDKVNALAAMWKRWSATLEEPRWLPGGRGSRR